MGMRIRTISQSIKRKLVELNWFQSIPPSQDPILLRQQRHQTRLYLILFFTGLLILSIFTSIQPHTITITVKLPLLTKFTQLNQQYPETLNCPCNQTTIEYHQFITDLKPQFHSICSSEFITSRWINLYFSISPMRIPFTHDIQYQSQIHFQLLSTLCQMANETIEENLQIFYQTKFFTNQTLNESSFYTQIDLLIDQFKSTIPESYLRTLHLIRANSEINQFIVPLNSRFWVLNDDYSHLLYTMKPVLNEFIKKPNCEKDDNCPCLNVSNGECVRRTMIFKAFKPIPIPGMSQVRFPLQSVLMSTLECFYNETCLFEITRHIDATFSSTNFSILQLLHNQNQYDEINKSVNQLFIQSWKNQSSYELYFNQCHPLTCQYSYQSKFDVIYVITTIIAFVGGLNTALKLLVPLIIKYVPKIWKKTIHRKRNNVQLNEGTSSIQPSK